MDIDELLLILEKSRTGKIQKIDDDFYDRLRERIEELEELRKKTDNDREISRIEDELRTLKRIRRRIFEIRTGKIVRAAWSEVCETESGIEGLENLIEAEKNLLRKLVEVINELDLHIETAKIKLKYKIALADCYVLALSRLKGCKAVFRKREKEMPQEIEKDFDVLFLEDY